MPVLARVSCELAVLEAFFLAGVRVFWGAFGVLWECFCVRLGKLWGLLARTTPGGVVSRRLQLQEKL